MLFIHTLDKVLSGEKTQTRRIRKNNHAGSFTDGTYFAVYNTVTGYPTWQVGRDYAVQPGRGKAQVARIRITGVRLEDVREISDGDVKAEGFETASDFFITWCKMHDKSQMLPIVPDYFTGSIVWQGVRSELQQRPAERYQAWALTFEVVK
jgi:hypothetical protein